MCLSHHFLTIRVDTRVTKAATALVLGKRRKALRKESQNQKILHGQIQLQEYAIPLSSVPAGPSQKSGWWYLGNQERYHRSAVVKTTRLLSLDKFYHFIFISNSFDPKFTRLNRMMVFWEAGKSCRWAFYDIGLIIKSGLLSSEAYYQVWSHRAHCRSR